MLQGSEMKLFMYKSVDGSHHFQIFMNELCLANSRGVKISSFIHFFIISHYNLIMWKPIAFMSF